MSPELEEVLRYYLNKYNIVNTSNLPDIRVDTFIGLVKDKLHERKQ